MPMEPMQARKIVPRKTGPPRSAWPEVWAFGLGMLFAALLLGAWVIPIHGAPAVRTAFREDTLDSHLQRFWERNLREYLDAVGRDYDRLTGGTDEATYHEALTAEMHAEQVLKMIDRTLGVLDARSDAWLQPFRRPLATMRVHYAGLLRELRLHRADVAPKPPQEPMELIPTPPSRIPRFDG